MVTIREMKDEDAEQVYQIEKNSFSHPWQKKDFIESIEDSNRIYLVAEKEEIVGYCGLWIVLDEGQINNVVVKDGMRGEKIGTLLMKELINRGMYQGIKAFTLEVRKSNEAAIRLYKKLGFESAGIRKNFYEKPIEDGIIMWLYIK